MLLRHLPLGAIALLSAVVLNSCSVPQGSAVKDQKLVPKLDPSPAKPGGKAGHGTMEFRLGYYNNEDSPGDGNPFLDEELTVIEPVIYLSYNTTDDTAWWGKLSYDNVSSASIQRLNDYPGSQQSGASGDYYLGLDVGRQHQSSDHQRHDTWIHASAEYDYRSFGLGGSVSWDAPDRNSTTKVNANLFIDDLDLIRFNGQETGTDNRLSLTMGWTEYRVMSKHTHGELGSTLTYQNGFLGTPYNGVVLEDPSVPNDPSIPPFHNNARGVEVFEKLPDTRIRVAVHGRVRTSLNENHAFEMGGRLYADDWGITSLTLEPKLYSWLVKNRLRSRLRYRYYTQTAADDFQETFTPADASREFLTQDSDLGDFDSHTFGGGLTWVYSPQTDVHLALDYVLRSDGIDQVFASISTSTKF